MDQNQFNNGDIISVLYTFLSVSVVIVLVCCLLCTCSWFMLSEQDVWHTVVIWPRWQPGYTVVSRWLFLTLCTLCVAVCDASVSCHVHPAEHVRTSQTVYEDGSSNRILLLLKCLHLPLVAVCSTAHKPRLLHVSRWDTGQTYKSPKIQSTFPVSMTTHSTLLCPRTLRRGQGSNRRPSGQRMTTLTPEPQLPHLIPCYLML